MKFAWLFTCLFGTTALFAQRVDTFGVKKAASARAKTISDTFSVQTYLSEKTEVTNRITYRTGIKITGPNSLIYFKATQSILDSAGVSEDKNASIGEYYNLLCTQSADSIFFLLTQLRSSARNPGTTLEITKAFKGTKVNGAIWMEVSTASASLEVIPKQEQERFVLFKEELKITRRKR